MSLHDHTSVGAPQQSRIHCSLATGQVVTLSIQGHSIRGTGGESFSQTDVQSEGEGACPHRMCATAGLGSWTACRRLCLCWRGLRGGASSKLAFNLTILVWTF